MRVVYLTRRFYQGCAIYARPGSPQEKSVRRVLDELEDEQHPLPARQDEEAFRSPQGTIWARRVPGTGLLLHYVILPMMIEVREVYPDWGPKRGRP